MKLYQSIGPNPHVVRMFMAEKNMDIPMETVDLMGGENRREAYLAVNPRGQSPALVTDSGLVVTEITAICEYLEDIHPAPALIGTTPDERGETRMWTRRIDLSFCEPAANGFRFSDGLKMFESRIRCVPEAADGLKAVAQDGLAWLDGQMQGKTWVCGDRFTLADIMLYCFLHFAARVGQPINEAHTNIAGFYERAGARPTAGA
ncbi:MAG: glutathione S-transferase family protein [Alphaproteobacteria bacterium]|nr:glutathione S-transferase family protein [Alphaproteobacteria bacterium]